MTQLFARFQSVSCAVVVCLLFVSTTLAEVSTTGNVKPTSDPETWTSSTGVYVGNIDGDGTLSITNGSGVENGNSHIGHHFGSSGEVTVDGLGSTWTCNNLQVGYSVGDGTLNITNGGAVSVAGNTWVAQLLNSSGEIYFDNGTLTTKTLLCASDDLTGTGVINTNGLVSDVNLVFDAKHGLNQTFHITDNPGQDITVNLNVNENINEPVLSMGAGYEGIGTMSISDGRVIESYQGYIGLHPGSIGEVTVSDAGSSWKNNYELNVGQLGRGNLIITNGGTVTNGLVANIGSSSGSEGKVAVSGVGSMWTNKFVLYVGKSGNGTLNITNGGTVVSNDQSYANNYSYIGYESGGTGNVTVDGDGSTWTNKSFLYIGYEGYGTLDITNGGAVSNERVYIGRADGSAGEVTVDGTGSTWINNEDLYVGYSGDGTLVITNGGIVSNNYGYIAYRPHSTSEVAVNGTGSIWTNNGTIYVGNDYAKGTLNITNGGIVTSNAGKIEGYTGSISKVMVSGIGSRWTNNGKLIIDVNSKLNITNGGFVSNGLCSINSMSDWTSEAMVSGVGSTWINNDDLNIGTNGRGLLTISNGGLVSVAGVLTIDYYGYGGFIEMCSGGMLALYDPDWISGDDLIDFLALVSPTEGTHDIRYWNGSEWSKIRYAIEGVDYTLIHETTGDLAGYTVLTVMAVPEPVTLGLLAVGGLAMLRRRKNS